MNGLTRNQMGVGFCVAFLITLGTQWNLTRTLLFDGYARHPFIVAENDDEIYYLTLVQESAKGERGEGSPYLKEYRDHQFTYPMIGVKLTGWLQRTFLHDIKRTAIILDYSAVFLVSVLVLLSTWIFFSRSWIGLLAGASYLAWPMVFHTLSRPVSPQLNLLFLFGFFTVFFSQSSSRLRLVVLGVAGGLLFYVYPYYWSFALIWLALEELNLLIRRQWNFRRLLVYAPFGIVALPYVWQTIQTRNFPAYGETMQRLGLLHNRLPAGITTLMLISGFALGLFFLGWGKRRHKMPNSYGVDAWRMVWGGLLTSWLVLTQQLVTGVQLEANAHYYPLILFILILTAWVGWEEIQTHRLITHFHLQWVLPLLGCVLVFVCSLSTRISANAFEGQNIALPATRAEREVHQWFREQGIRDQVVYAPHEVSERLVLYTQNYVAFSHLQRFLLTPSSELVERFQYADVLNKELFEPFEDRHYHLFGFTYLAPRDKDRQWLSWKNRLLGRPATNLSLVSYVDEDYQRAQQQRQQITLEGFHTYLRRFHVDYVVYRVREATHPLYESLPGQVVFSNEEYVIKKRLSAVPEQG